MMYECLDNLTNVVPLEYRCKNGGAHQQSVKEIKIHVEKGQEIPVYLCENCGAQMPSESQIREKTYRR